jgi:hypothetical protein
MAKFNFSFDPQNPDNVVHIQKPEQEGPPSATSAQVPFFITGKMKNDLSARGYTPEQIKEMKPAEAHEILSTAAPEPAVGASVEPTEKVVQFLQSKPVTWRDRIITAQDLCDAEYPPLRYVIPGLITEGLTLLVGRPKPGKSWLLLQILSSVALGTLTLSSDMPIESGDVLSLNLEDGNRRLQRRMRKYFGDNRDMWPARMTIAPEWSKLDKGGLQDIREWCKSVKKPTAIGIDTIKKIRPEMKSVNTAYDNDYAAGEGLLKLCHEFPGLAIITAHHDRKMDADDVFDTVKGSIERLSRGIYVIAATPSP